MEELLEQISEEYQGVFVKLIEMTDAFCGEYLNEEYEQLCREVAQEVCQKGSPVKRGKAAGWASGIVHALGMVNFLQDPSTEPYLKSDAIAKAFGVSQGTMTAKSKIIRDMLDMMPLDPDWCLPSLVEDNPLVWMITIDGFAMDVRSAPREIQEEAYRKGLIPYIPEPRKEAGAPEEDKPNIIKFPAQEQKPSTSKRAEKVRDEGPGLFD